MTTADKLNELEDVIGKLATMEGLAAVAREAVAIARNVDGARRREVPKLLDMVLEYHFENHRLRTYLRQALRGWIGSTPDVNEAVIAFQIAQDVGLGE